MYPFIITDDNIEDTLEVGTMFGFIVYGDAENNYVGFRVKTITSHAACIPSGLDWTRNLQSPPSDSNVTARLWCKGWP